MVKVKQDKSVINKAVYLALAVNMDGKKELLGIWISKNEGSNSISLRSLKHSHQYGCFG